MRNGSYTPELREQIVTLGKMGKTYSEIQKQFPIPKSTLSLWFKNAGKKPDRTRQLEHLKRARIIAFESIQRNKLQRVEEAVSSARTVVAELEMRNNGLAKALLAMLYWAEGTKSERSGGPTFTNTDPILALFYLKLLRKAYPIDEDRLRIRIHIHHYHNPRESLRFWSELLGIPESQFGKIYVKKRSTRKKFRRNFQGICFIKYFDTSIRRELLALGRLIAEQYSNAPVVQRIGRGIADSVM